MFKKILVATDMLEACDAAVLAALEIARQNNGVLQILHVMESSSTIYRNFVKHFRTGEEIVSTDEYEKSVKREIEEKCAGALGPDGKYEIMVTAGFPWEEILKWAREERVDLIVLGPHAGRAAEKGVVRTSGGVGSTVEGVIRRERCPVMIVNRLMPQKSLKFEKVMVSIDFSKSCICALQFAIKLSQKYGSKLFTFHLLPVPSSSEYSKADYEIKHSAVEKKLEALCKKIPPGIDYECVVGTGGQPHLEIEKYADRNGMNLIVMGSHTKIKDGKWYVGSAVEQVSKQSVCPVVVVTDPKALLKMNG